MTKLKEPIYFESGFENFKIDTNESDRVEDLIGSINSVLKNKICCFVIVLIIIQMMIKLYFHLGK